MKINIGERIAYFRTSKDKIEKWKAGERKSSCKAFLLNTIKAIYIYLTGFHNLFKLTYELTYPSEKSLKFPGIRKPGELNSPGHIYWATRIRTLK